MMKISVYAEGCPRLIKDNLLRILELAHVRLALVSNQTVSTCPSAWIIFLQAVDVANEEVVGRVKQAIS